MIRGLLRRAAFGLAAAVMAASGCASTNTPARPSPFPHAPSAAEPAAPARVLPPAPAAATPGAVLETALDLQGVPYRSGGEDPTSGFDCSGFVQYVFARHHLELPRTVDEQYRFGVKVGLTDIRRGDLVFFSTTAPGATHVGIAMGAGEFVHAPTEKGAVRIEHLDTPYWHNRFVGARRVLISPSSAGAGRLGAAGVAGLGGRGRIDAAH